MPPPSSFRKASTTTTSNHPLAPSSSDIRRTTSGRAVRANAARPTNYYARNFANTTAQENDRDDTPTGFFPAVTFFTDAITALPKEVMRQFTQMKEVEAKIWANGEKFEQVVGEVMEYPVPSKVARVERDGSGDELGPEGQAGSAGQGQATLMSLTANNSVVGSTAPSVVNGGLPAQMSAQHSVAGSWNGEDVGGRVMGDEDLAKRQKYHEMRTLIANMLPNLDEKGVVLSEANRILARQHSRIDSVMPYLEEEISEEARLGSMTHWAYSDNRQRKQTTGNAANKRDVAATNSLAAAANAVHESDIAAARTVAGREGREKQKGKSREQLDSDFDDRPKKPHAKIAKSKISASGGLGTAANGEPVKRRRVDKGLAAPGMERSASSKGAKAAAKEVPRSTPGTEPVKKARTKPAPLPAKRKGVASAQDSPAMASSPLQATFTANMEPPTSRAPGGRMRQSSNATNLRHEKLAGDEGSRPTSAPSKPYEKKRKAPVDEADEAKKTTESSDGQARINASARDPDRAGASHSGSNSGKAGLGSAVGTPRTETFPEGSGPAAMQRARSTRSRRENNGESESEAAPEGHPSKMLHKRQTSNLHLVKQLASFNRSPDLDRHRDDDSDELDESDEALQRRRMRRDKAQAEEAEAESKSPKKRRPASRRNTLLQGHSGVASPEGTGLEGGLGDEDVVMGDGPAENASPSPLPEGDVDVETAVPDLEPTHPSSPPTQTAPSSPRSSPTPEPLSPPQPIVDSPASQDGMEMELEVEEEFDELEADDDEEGDPDDPNETKYCYCDRGSYGEMIACDNEQCPREWFHLGCTGLGEPPEEEEKWFCRECAPVFAATGRGGGNGNGGGRGKGKGRGRG